MSRTKGMSIYTYWSCAGQR